MMKNLFIIGCPIARNMLQKDLETNNNIMIKYYKLNENIPEFNFNLKDINKEMIFNNNLLDKLKFKTQNNKNRLLIFVESI
jgi:hypothetical protein